MKDVKRLILLLHSWNLELLSKQLRELGFRVAVCDGFDKSVDMAIRLRPDVIITHMIFNFREYVKRLMAGIGEVRGANELMMLLKNNPRTKHTKFIIFSISSDQQMREGCPGADAYVHAKQAEPILALVKAVQELLPEDT